MFAGKDPKKKKTQKQKMRDLNVKGEAKTGSEMDAFVDTEVRIEITKNIKC